MRSTLLSLTILSLNLLAVLSQEDPELPEIPDAPDGDIDIIIDFNTGIVDGIPLPGDLADLNFTTSTSLTIAQILMLNTTAQGGTDLFNSNDLFHPCYKWTLITPILTELFKNNQTQECNDNARAAVRAGFHDAGTWSRKLAARNITQGGADGSLYLFDEAKTRAENRGLETITEILGQLARQYQLSVADMFQFAAAHATVTCPLGPRMRTFVGRPEATSASPDGLLPSSNDDANTQIELFRDKGIGQLDLVALVGAHSVSKQRHVDESRPNTSQDSTPGVWDTEFYGNTLNSDSEPLSSNMTTFPSDKALSQHPSLVKEWNGYVARQNDWVEHFSRAYLRLSLVGVQNIQKMVECTNALPLHRSTFP